jgi:hypothetical protein
VATVKSSAKLVEVRGIVFFFLQREPCMDTAKVNTIYVSPLQRPTRNLGCGADGMLMAWILPRDATSSYFC